MSDPKAFVAGWPIEHSRSPLIHRFWLRHYGLAGDYLREAVPAEELRDFLSSVRSRGYVGGNVTIPHKEDAARACRRLTSVAQQLGAANTLWFEGDTLCGDNTDVYGFSANLDEHAPEWRDGSVAVVLGAGGASRAVLQAIFESGYDTVNLLNRTVGRAEQLAHLFGDRVTAAGLDTLPQVLATADLVVNTTAAGMAGQDALAIDWQHVQTDTIVTDIVYVPLRTPFLSGAAERGAKTVDGLGMLLHQAAPGFERWFGHRPVVDAALRKTVLADLPG